MGRVTGVSVLRGAAVRRDGESVEITGSRLRALLALLAVAPGEVRRAEYLADQLWNGEPPSANALQALVSRLRRVVGAESVASRPTGYVLDLNPADVDLCRFEQLAEFGTPEAAREALHLAGPEPLAEFADVPDLAGLARVIETECGRLALLAGQGPPPAVEVPPAPLVASHPIVHRLIGRDAVLSEIQDRLGRTRLLTLTGAGGSGKTSLAKAVATAHDVAHVAELAPVTAQAVDAEVFAAVGGRENLINTSERTRLAASYDDSTRLLDALGDRPALLVLDNCEHVIDAAAGLAVKILAACPRVTILATSREPLGVPGEQRLPVAPLAVPPHDSSEARLTSYAAMQLLLERGRAVRPGLGAAGEDGAALAEICRRLDGIPLALELAAARFNVLTPRQVAERLDDRFRLLTTGARTALPRQQTLRAVVDWSWDLLSGFERELLAVCGVFAGGAALEDLEGVSGLDALDVLDQIDRLVSKSLVLAEPAASPAGGDQGMRYRLLETIREYALERLAEQGREKEVRTRHANYFADLAERADPQLRGPGQVEWMYRLDAAEDNLRAALEWALCTDDAACALRLCDGVGWYGTMRGKQFDHNRVPRALELADRLGVPHDASYLRVLTFDALYCFERGVTLEEASAQLNRARELARAGDWRDALYSLAEIAAALYTAPHSVEEVFECEYARLAAHGEAWGTAVAQMFHAKVSMEDPARAEALTEQALATFRRLGDQWGIANCGQTVAMLESQRGAHREALAVIEDALPATRLIGSATDEVMLLVMAANEHDSLGDRERAARTLARAHEISRARPESHAKIYLMAAECVRARREGRLDQSQAWLDELGRAAGKTFIGPVKALLNTQQAWITLARGNLAETERLLRQAFEFAIAFHYDRPDIGAVIEAQAGLELARGDARRAAWLHGLYAVVRGRELPLSVTPDLAGTAAAARAELGDAAYGAAYAEGRAVESEAALRTCSAVFGANPEEAVPGWWLLRRDHDAQM
ncbi:ATP-binding protein [Actinospica sp.]|uniref:ATP-binding protein n=1 Tax=Actinospica sp. TaxID=1872142 RepID=UPI002C41DEA3|nr:winged helix-turn-helix domain-containing protein [Actinospica sp.]HWG25440.1 winged helix-turn-helix domain-containing protein [Actinospica sp.]